MKWKRTVVFEVEADSIEEATSIWCQDGPETGDEILTIGQSALVQWPPTETRHAA